MEPRRSDKPCDYQKGNYVAIEIIAAQRMANIFGIFVGAKRVRRYTHIYATG